MAKTVLVVEDFDDVRNAMKFLVQLGGHEVIEAADGRQAVERASQHLPDLILMDLAMPVYDGIEATRELRSDPKTSKIPIVAVTSYGQQYREQALAAGCDEVYDKPQLMSDLSIVNDLVSKYASA
ncbi:MAG: response regulator [Pyrinomonadaceae bacterium]